MLFEEKEKCFINTNGKIDVSQMLLSEHGGIDLNELIKFLVYRRIDMSLAKRQLEEKDNYYEIAFSYLLEIGAIKTCDMHSDFYYNTYSYDEKIIYAMAINNLKKEYGNDQNYKLFQSQIHEILSYAASGKDQCPFCDKLMKS